jgi:hypothetical protein
MQQNGDRHRQHHYEQHDYECAGVDQPLILRLFIQGYRIGRQNGAPIFGVVH